MNDTSIDFFSFTNGRLSNLRVRLLRSLATRAMSDGAPLWRISWEYLRKLSRMNFCACSSSLVYSISFCLIDFSAASSCRRVCTRLSTRCRSFFPLCTYIPFRLVHALLEGYLLGVHVMGSQTDVPLERLDPVDVCSDLPLEIVRDLRHTHAVVLVMFGYEADGAEGGVAVLAVDLNLLVRMVIASTLRPPQQMLHLRLGFQRHHLVRSGRRQIAVYLRATLGTCIAGKRCSRRSRGSRNWRRLMMLIRTSRRQSVASDATRSIDGEQMSSASRPSIPIALPTISL